VPRLAFRHGDGVTQLSREQFARIAAEVDLMLAEGEQDEAWRVLTMFGAGQFNYRLADFPAAAQHAATGCRQRSYPALLEQVRGVAGFVVEIIGVFGHDGREFPLVRMQCAPAASPFATIIPVSVAAGIHGDEPDSVFGALEFARRFAASAELRASYALTIYPCLNPVGYERMTRVNGTGHDLNREFSRHSAIAEVQIMERDLATQQCLGMIGTHSDYESFGIYAYAAGAVLSERLAKPALFQASSVIPVNTDPTIDGQPAQLGIINQKYPGSLGPLTRGHVAPFDITIETPNLLALRKRVEAHAIACETILHEYRAVAAEAMYL
jgi:hypothetical protein